MKVKQLIEELSKLNPESNILFSSYVESGVVSGCTMLGDYSINSYTKQEFKEELEGIYFENVEDEDETKEELLEDVDDQGVVVIEVGGEETFCG